MKCSNHPRYKGVRKSTTGCLKCKIIRALRRISSACGVSAPVPATRVQDFIRKGGARFASEQDARVEKPSGDDARPVEHIKSPFVDLLAADLEPSKEFPGVMEGPCFTAPQEAEDSWEAPNDAPRRQENFIFIGGKDHGCITSFSLEQRESAPNLYDGYLLTHFVDGSRAYVLPGIDHKVAEQYLTQYRTTGEMKACVDSKHDFGKPLQHFRKYLFIGGRRNRCWHNVELEHGVGPDVLTADEQQYFKAMFHGSAAGYEHIAYVERDYDIQQAHQDVLRYERETPPDSGGKLC